jgi:uncharacterized membrane protein
MPSFEDSIDVDIPVRVAYDQWTRFEEYPSFMPTVKHVDQRDDVTLDVTSTFAGKRADWTAEITDQTPDVRVAWKSTTGGGSEYATTVLLQPLGEGRTRVTMKADVHPKGLLETVAVNVGLPLLKRRVKGDLTGFKRFMESRRAGTDASRGEIRDQAVRDG